MKPALLKSIVATAAVAILPISLQLYAQNVPSGAGQIHYSVINLGTLGGTASNGFGGVNNTGWVTGDANLAGDHNEHAFLWRDGVMTDLGTLGGPNSSVAFPVKDDKGLVVGGAQSPTVDPLGEFWGAAYFCTALNCQGYQNLQLGFVWRDGVMTALAPIGGNNSEAFGVNNRGQAVGIAETATQDRGCLPPEVFDFEAVIWGPKPGQIEKLPVLPGDSIGAALAINDKGQVTGLSGLCAVPTSLALGVHAVLWDRGAVTYLGGLGGVMNNSGLGINNEGQIVGVSDLPGDTAPCTPACHAFLWTQEGGMQDLGTLPGDVLSVANDINDKGHVVGISCDINFNCRAFLWEDGVMTDLNMLIPADSPLFLTLGAGINNRGEISGSAFDPKSGESPAFLAIPCDDEGGNRNGCEHRTQGANAAAQEPSNQPRVILPENVREMLQRRMGFRRF